MMSRNCDEDSGRSTCSAASVGFSPIINHGEVNPLVNIRYIPKTQETAVNTDLKVTVRPRSCIILSPDDSDPFPSCKLIRNCKKPIDSLFETPRKGGLSNAHSTLDLVSSTKLELPIIENNAVSMNTVNFNDHKSRIKPLISNFKRGKPVQRAASRLYKADCGFKGKDGCIGPEFIVRASQPVKHLDLTVSAIADKRIITVVLLNGQKIEVLCHPNTVTAGQLFEALIHSEKYEHNFMLGIAILLGGDFVFLPDDYKIKKIAPESWYKLGSKKKIIDNVSLTVFLRIKFFLPTNISKNIQGGEWRHRVYLQLRRATVEGLLTSTIQNLILLAGYALHIEFGEFSYREHGTGDYFLLEHYLPETLITNDMADVKLRMKKSHESRKGLEKNTAIINYITLTQTFRDYGTHFYSAVWATRDGFCRDVWLSIGPRGVTLYSRNNHNVSNEASSNFNRIVLQSLPWHHIQKFCFNKKSLYIIPNTYSGLSKIGIKYKLKMTDSKSYFVFWLASLHHRLYLKLYAKEEFIICLSDELSYPLNKDSPKKSDCSNYQDSYNLAVRNPMRMRRPARRKFRVDLFGEKKVNKENEKPDTEELLKRLLMPQQGDETFNFSNTQGNSSNDGISSSESFSLPKRPGVKMGTRVFNGMNNRCHKLSPSKYPNEFLKSDVDLTMTQSDSDDLGSEQKQHCNVNSMKLLPERNYNQDLCHAATAYVLESPKVYSEVFNFNGTTNESCINSSIFDKLDNMGCVQGERVFVTAVLERNCETNALGLQVAEGSDGNVYIKSITPNGPADMSKKLLAGDQIISVNGQTLLNVKYNKALSMLQSAPQKVELIVLQNTVNKNNTVDYNKEFPAYYNNISKTEMVNQNSRSVASALDTDVTDEELLNEEALKTIYALIKLTKDKVISRIKDRSINENSPAKNNLQKWYSENQINEEFGVGNYSSHENTPKKRSNIEDKFNTWRAQVPYGRQKRRPLSLSIPTEVNLPNNYLDDNMDELLQKTSLKSIQSSLHSLDKSPKSGSSKSVPLPRNFGLSRRWLGPVRYPVTPCKNAITEKSAIAEGNLVRKHFVYGAGDSDDDQIFL